MADDVIYRTRAIWAVFHGAVAALNAYNHNWGWALFGTVFVVLNLTAVEGPPRIGSPLTRLRLAWFVFRKGLPEKAEYSDGSTYEWKEA